MLDVRIGGLISRIDTVAYVLNEYLAGRMEKIFELEEERIEYFCGRLREDEVYAPFHNHWETMYTVNHIKQKKFLHCYLLQKHSTILLDIIQKVKD